MFQWAGVSAVEQVGTSIVRPGGETAVSEDGDGGVETEVADEARVPKPMLDPKLPSPAEVEEHRLTHLPFRNWCPDCVKGRGKDAPHQKGRGERGLPEIHVDYMFMGPKDVAGETVPCLVVKEGLSKMVMASAVPRKSTGTFIARRVVAFLEEIGCLSGDLIVKSDQEPAVCSVVQEVGRLRSQRGVGKFIVENSPVKSSESNRVVERAIQSVAGQVRVIKQSVERRWQT